MADQDLYRTLGVARGVSEAELKKAYRKLAKDLHPDRNPGDTAAEERFKRVSSAYDVLSDPKKRALYDEFGDIGLRDGFDAAQYRAYQAGGRGRGGFGGAGGAGSMPLDLEELLRNMGGAGNAGGGMPFDMGEIFGGRRPAPPRKPRDAEAMIEIAFRDAILGVEEELRIDNRAVKVRIPAGARDGSKLRLRGQGHAGRGGEAGDLVLTVAVRPHKHFFFESDDDALHVRLPITVAEAYLGAKVDVPTPEGAVQMKIPAGAQSGQKLRLKGKGAASKRGQPRGDLIVHLSVTVPSERTPELDAAFATIAEAMTSDPRSGIEL